MPHLKTEIISARNDAGASESFKAKILVNVTGDFYTYFPDYLKISVDNFIGIDYGVGSKINYLATVFRYSCALLNKL